MFIAMNRFKVAPDQAESFEAMWLSREVHLHTVAGFKAFHMLRGPAGDDHVLYASHTVWESRDAFEGWTRSDAFRLAHRNAGAPGRGSHTLEPPRFEGFEVIQTVGADGRTDAA
jgi:heme-degrading monooxygenase HmoA